MNMPARQIPPERQTLYYVGLALMVVGVLLFLSVFVTGIANFGNFNNFHQRAQFEMARAFGGMVLVVIGRVMSSIGARGWAGSGIVLDPQKARKDVEPWSRMAGGALQDALSEVEALRKTEDSLEPPAVQVKIRCQKCQSLNDETAKFCNQCGSAI